jgi:hypothetical protein
MYKWHDKRRKKADEVRTASIKSRGFDDLIDGYRRRI